ncbi:MAG: addiction module protein [Planctomycetales bacterium]|nr:addiction module protein [Planctomycetales bacterium]
MQADATNLFHEALKLSPDQREELAERLLLSLHPGGEGDENSAELHAEWDSEIARRLAEIKSGNVPTKPAEEVHRELGERVRQ